MQARSKPAALRFAAALYKDAKMAVRPRVTAVTGQTIPNVFRA
jgi:hypothetical protein